MRLSDIIEETLRRGWAKYEANNFIGSSDPMRIVDSWDAETKFAYGYLHLTDAKQGDPIDIYVKFIAQSADEGFMLAQFILGNCHYEGYGRSHDRSKAMYWWRKAAEQGLTDASNRIIEAEVERRKRERIEEDQIKVNPEPYAMKKRILEERRKQISKYQGCILATAGVSQTVEGGYTVGLKSDGTVVAVGSNDYGQCNTDLWHGIVAICKGNKHTVGLKADGTVVAVGNNENGQCNIEDWQEIVAISAGELHTVGLKANGTVVAVGNNEFGQCNTEDWRDIIAISSYSVFKSSGEASANFGYTVGLRADGTVVAVGTNYNGSCDTGEWSEIEAISLSRSSFEQTVGLKADGTVVAVGDNREGQCNIEEWHDIVAISAGYEYTVGLKADGKVVAAGVNDYGQCSIDDWQDIVAVTAGFLYTVGLKADGTVVVSGGFENTESWQDIVAISTGMLHTVGLKADGTVVAVGKHEEGQCDINDWRDIGPVDKERCMQQIKEEKSRVEQHHIEKQNHELLENKKNFLNARRNEIAKYQGCIITSFDDDEDGKKGYTVGLKSDGTVVATGYDSDGKCKETEDWHNIVAISASKDHTVGLKADGTVVAVGDNAVYKKCETKDWRDIVAISASGLHTIGLKADGTVIATALDSELDATSWRDIIAVSSHSVMYHDETSVAYFSAVGLKKDGTVVAVGTDFEGSCKKTGSWKNIKAISVGKSNYQYTVGLKEDGTVVAVGDNQFGQCETENWQDIAAITTGIVHTVGLKTDGTVVTTVDVHNTNDWQDIVAISAGFHTVGLKADGTVVAVGLNEFGECNTEDWQDIIAISAGAQHTVGLKADGTVVAVGSNENGQCNTGSWQDIGPSIREKLLQQNQDDNIEEVQQKFDGSTMSMITCVGSVKILLYGKKGTTVIDWGDGIKETVVINKDNLYFSDYLKNDNKVALEYSHTFPDTSAHTITITGENITHVSLEGNQLTDLDVSNNLELKMLNCFENHLTGLNVSKNKKLLYLRCYSNRLNSLDVSENTVLIELNCYKNQLKSLDIRKNIALTKLNCRENKLANLDISNNTDLKTFSCGSNLLKSLDVSNNTALVDLFCFENQLTSLDISKNIVLTELNCFSNRLMSLDVSTNTALSGLTCHKNQLMNLDLRKNVALKKIKTDFANLKAGGTAVATGSISQNLKQATEPEIRESEEQQEIEPPNIKRCVDKKSELEVHRKEIAKYKGCISASDARLSGETVVGHIVGLKSDGTVVAVGDNSKGQCNTHNWRNIVEISTGSEHTVGLKEDGRVVAVGENKKYGQCNTEQWRDIIAISAGQLHTLGLKKDGTVVVAGELSCKLKNEEWRDIVAISSYSVFVHHPNESFCMGWAVGLKTDGTVVATMHNSDISGWRDIVAISVGKKGHIVGLKADGTVVSTGYNKDGRCNTEDWQDIVAISAGDKHTVGLKADGTVVAVGDNQYDTCNTEDWKDIVAIAAGILHTVGIKVDGTVISTIDTHKYSTKGWQDIVAISSDFETVGLKADGTVVTAGDNRQCNTGSWRDIGPFSTEKCLQRNQKDKDFEGQHNKGDEQRNPEINPSSKRMKWLPFVVGIILFLVFLPKSIFFALASGVAGYFLTVFFLNKSDEKKEKELKAIRERIEQEDPDTQYRIGISLMEKNDFLEAIKRFEKAFALGHLEAQSRINECSNKIEEAKRKTEEAERREAERREAERREAERKAEERRAAEQRAAEERRVEKAPAEKGMTLLEFVELSIETFDKIKRNYDYIGYVKAFYPHLASRALSGDKVAMKEIADDSYKMGIENFGHTESARKMSACNFWCWIFWSNKLKN